MVRSWCWFCLLLLALILLGCNNDDSDDGGTSGGDASITGSRPTPAPVPTPVSMPTSPPSSPSPSQSTSPSPPPPPPFVAIPRSNETDAQFLIKATFGPTRSSLAALKQKASYREWIQEQLRLPVELHRAYYRARVNSQSNISLHAGSPRDRCAAGSRFVGLALTSADVGKPIVVQSNRILVDGLFRSDIDTSLAGNGLSAPGTCDDKPLTGGRSCASQTINIYRCRFNTWWRTNLYCRQTCYDQLSPYDGDDCSTSWPSLGDFSGFVCQVEDSVGGHVILSTASKCTSNSRRGMRNPAVWLSSPSQSTSTTLQFQNLKAGVLLLSEGSSSSACSLGEFIEHGGLYYRHQPRINLLENSLEQPAAGLGQDACPSVPRSFLNEKTCVLRDTCTPMQLVTSTFNLNESTLQQFYISDRKYVYAISGLKTTKSPCKTLARWKLLSCGSGCTATAGIADADAAAIRTALDAKQGDIRDVQAACASVNANSIVQHGSNYFQHVHLHEYNVYDFTAWVDYHPGGGDKIQKWAEAGKFTIEFPSGHDMARWEAGSTSSRLQYVGRLGDTISFASLPSTLVTQRMANSISSASGGAYFEACGSPGEVANDPSKGHQFGFWTDFEATTKGVKLNDQRYDNPNYGNPPAVSLIKMNVWLTKALSGSDQLRQRMAWALSQIIVVGESEKGNYAEHWINWYDIFVRNAFGNYRDLLREVTYSPMMGAYLTFMGSSSYDYNNKWPDENYAREVMQLFTIGLFRLHPNGSHVLDANGRPIPTYSNDQIVSFARVFTGFDQQLPRSNVDDIKGSNNLIDPMKMTAAKHDAYPKPDLDGNFLGDGYPRCSDLPSNAFLAQGAKYEFRGYSAGSDVAVLELQSGSALKAVLCGGSSGSCQFSRTVELSSTVLCHDTECTSSPPILVKADGGYYEYFAPTCMDLFFYNGRIIAPGGHKWSWNGMRKCVDVKASGAGASCCAGCTNIENNYMRNVNRSCATSTPTTWPGMFKSNCNNSAQWQKKKFCQLACWQGGSGYSGDDCSLGSYKEKRTCSFPKELLTLSSAESRCQQLGLTLCPRQTTEGVCGYDNDVMLWTTENCSLAVAVDADGRVSLQADDDSKQNWFYVPWTNGHPSPTNCPSACTVSGKSCICQITIEEKAVFSSPPSKQDILRRLKIGAHKPQGSCSECTGDVKWYGGSALQDSTVFEVEGRFFRNLEGIVHVAGYSFRNPPNFVNRLAPTQRAALAEVESLLDHLFHHANTPTFIAYRLIQRFVSSNPSAGYIQDVASAFRTGSFNGVTYNGTYGDLSATLAAILLHQEAQTSQVPSSTAGSLREPLLKVVHFLRSMEFSDKRQRELVIRELNDVTGQSPLRSPTVFNFYTPSYQPARFNGSIVGPEFQIFTPPFFLNFLNGMRSIIVANGLSSFQDGFGFQSPNSSEDSLGLVAKLPELSLLLTGKSDAGTVVNAAVDAASAENKFQTAQMALVMAPAFNTLGEPQPQGQQPPAEKKSLAEPRSYKAMVSLYMKGGADTFNLLVPMDCSLYNEYRTIRQDIALQPFQLNEISVSGQACNKFGIHSNFANLKQLYDSKKAAFVSNVGSLVEPLTKSRWSSGGKRCVGLFSHSDQEYGAQTLECQTMGAAPRGIGGRISDALASGSQGYQTASFSIAGTATFSQGEKTNQEIISAGKGAVRLQDYDNLRGLIGNITGQLHKNVFAQEYLTSFAQAVQSSEELGGILDNVTLQTSYTRSNSLEKQLYQVARLITARSVRKAERDIFYVEVGGFDSHSEVIETLQEKFSEIDAAIQGFVAEMNAQGIFDKVVLFTSSDFGRTLPTNGQGTDHAWAGNYFVIGGDIRGGNVLNKFPSSLLEGNDQDAGRGRMIPQYPYESMMVPIAEWLGVEASQFSKVFPNLGNFNASHLIPRTTLFQN